MDRVVELRVHGVGGPTPDSVLGTVDPKPIAGAADERAGFYTRDEPGASGQRVEAFVWGGLNSKTKAQAAWWLLLPFSLINVAGWMIRPGAGAGPGGHEKPRSLVWWIRLLATFAGVLLTVLYILWLAVALLDAVAYQCGAQPDCVGRSWLLPLRWFHGHPLWRIAAGALLMGVFVIGVLFAARFTHRRYEEYEEDEWRRSADLEPERARGFLSRNDNLLHPRFWYDWQAGHGLFILHAMTAVTVMAVLVGHSVSIASEAEDLTALAGWEWALGFSAGLFALMLLLVIRVVRPPVAIDSGPNPHYRGQWLRRSGLVLALAAVGYVVGGPVIRPLLVTGSLEGALGLTTVVGWLFVGSVALLLPAFILLAVNASGSFRWGRAVSMTPRVGDGFRFLPPAVTVVAAFAIAGAGFGALIVRLADFLDGDGDTITFHTDRGAFEAVPGLAVDIFVIGLVSGLMWLGAALLRARLAAGYLEGVASDYEGLDDSARARLFVKRVARGRLLSQIGRSVDVVFTGLMVGTVIAGGVLMTRVFVLGHDLADVTRPLLGFGGEGEEITAALRHAMSWAVLLFIFPGALLIRAGARNQGSRRQVGKVWDSITFFPRRFHPLGPPCYAERAVPMLREHIRDRVTGGDGDPGGRVVVVSHSQGTVLALAALSQLMGEERHQAELVTGEARDLSPQRTYGQVVREEQARPGDAASEPHRMARDVTERVSLITLGSPLGQIHAPFFPTYFNLGLFEEVREDLDLRWQNFYRETDYIGKALFVPADAGLDLHGRFVAGGPAGTRPWPPDHSLLDPVEEFDRLWRHIRYEQEQTVQEWLARFVIQQGGGP